VSRCGISAPYSTGISKTVEKSWVKCKYSLRVYDEHVERLHISSYACQRSRQGLSESLRFLEKRLRSSIGALYRFGRSCNWFVWIWMVLNKSRARTLSEHKIYETSRKTCKRTANFYFGKNPLRQNRMQVYSWNSARYDFLISNIKY